MGFWNSSGGIWGASRHGLTVGFIATMVVCVANAFCLHLRGMRRLWSTRLMLYATVGDNPETLADLDGHYSMDAEVCDTNPTIGGATSPARTNKNVCNNEAGKCDSANTNVNGNDQDKVQKQTKQYVTQQAEAYVPANVAVAAVEQESSFNANAIHKDGTTTDYGLMQVNSGNFGHKVTGANGKQFTIDGNKVKSDCRYNVRSAQNVRARQATAYKIDTANSEPGGQSFPIAFLQGIQEATARTCSLPEAWIAD